MIKRVFRKRNIISLLKLYKQNLSCLFTGAISGLREAVQKKSKNTTSGMQVAESYHQTALE